MSDQDGFAVPSLPAKPKPTTSNQPSAPPLKYEKPSWSSEAMFDYKIEMLKGGLSVGTVEGPKKEFVTIGRLPICDIQMEHQVRESLVSPLYIYSSCILMDTSVNISLSCRDPIQSRRRRVHL